MFLFFVEALLVLHHLLLRLDDFILDALLCVLLSFEIGQEVDEANQDILDSPWGYTNDNSKGKWL